MTVAIVGVPTDFGTHRRGVDMGPSAIRYAGLADRLDGADIPFRDVGDIDVPSATEGREEKDEFPGTRAVSIRLQERLAKTLEADRIPLVLGGDHSVSIGSVGATGSGRAIGLVWFDAHGDFNTPEISPSGNVHGMTLAALLGRGPFGDRAWAPAHHLRPRNVVLVGTRDLDAEEADALRASEVTTYTMSDIDANGMGAITRQALARAGEGVQAVHVSVDLDFIDPIEAPGVGTPVHGGATYREAHLAMEIVGEELYANDRLAGMDLVEVNPIRDRENQTAELATELAASACGDRII